MRRNLIAGITLLGIGAVAGLIGARSCNNGPTRASAPAPATTEAGRPLWPSAPPSAIAAMKTDPPGALRLEGQVVDARDSQPVGGAIVWLGSEPPRTTTSEADGSFAFEGLLARRYRVEAWKGDL